MTTNGTTTGIDPAAIGTELRLGQIGRENVRTKGRRYLVEGRLTVRYCGVDRIVAHARGTEETHTLGLDDGAFHCSCQARGHCSHLEALMLVTQRPGDVVPREGWRP